MPISGKIAASRDDEELTSLAAGELIGSSIALSGQGSLFAASFTEDGRYMSWSVADVQGFLGRDPGLALKFNNIVNHNLVSQINRLALRV